MLTATCPYLGCVWSYRSRSQYLIEQSREVHMALCGARRLTHVPLLTRPERMQRTH